MTFAELQTRLDAIGSQSLKVERTPFGYVRARIAFAQSVNGRMTGQTLNVSAAGANVEKAIQAAVGTAEHLHRAHNKREQYRNLRA